MTRAPAMHAWRHPWWRWSVLSVGATALASVLVGFVWLPSAQDDFGAQGLWASICRAAGVPQRWGNPASPPPAARSGRTTTVALSRVMAHPADSDAAGRGATLALQQCTMCHGARGVSGVSGVSGGGVPNLAGQHAEVIVKQLSDYQRGDRTSAVMQAMAGNLGERDVLGLAAYYAALPQPATAPGNGAAPRLVSVGDPMRNIAPCSSCHGDATHKLGAPWLAGMPGDYLIAQLAAFASGARTNDSHAQMRNMARLLSAAEMAELAAFYAQR